MAEKKILKPSVDTAPETTISKADQIGKILDNAKDTPAFAKLNEDQREAALEIVKAMFDRFPNLDFPKQNKDGSIEMDLMNGGHIVVGVPTGAHVMASQREMAMFTEKGEKEDMQPAYILAACSNIDGEPCSIIDIQEKLSARDYLQLFNYFRSINLL